jgi:hypothetical protein
MLNPIDPSDASSLPVDDALDRTLIAPALPDGFRARVLTAVLCESLRQVEDRRQVLEREHAQALQQLRHGHLLSQRHTLALITASAFAAGACANLALPWLQGNLGLDSAVAIPLIALLIGAATGASVWVERFGRPDTLFDVGSD